MLPSGIIPPTSGPLFCQRSIHPTRLLLCILSNLSFWAGESDGDNAKDVANDDDENDDGD